MNTREVQTALNHLGWPIAIDGSYGGQTHEAVSDFQRGFAFWDLAIDGMAGPQTWNALQTSESRGGRTSDHFIFTEFASFGNHWIKLHRDLVRGLEKLRSIFYSGGMQIVSGYRDPRYNAEIGGASNSQHLYGNAADIPGRVHIEDIKGLRIFSGIGYRNTDRLVVHVDVRHCGPNTTGGTPTNPTVWRYQ